MPVTPLYMKSASLPTFLLKYIKGSHERETFFSFFLLRFHILTLPLRRGKGEDEIRGIEKRMTVPVLGRSSWGNQRRAWLN
jgi:hypothetical protein